RSDAGQARVVVTRDWDKATAGRIAAEDCEKVGHAIRQEIRGCIAQGVSRSRTLAHVARFLKMQTTALGYRPNDPAELDRICRIPDRLFWLEKPVFHRVYQHTYDRKASEDNMPMMRRQ